MARNTHLHPRDKSQPAREHPHMEKEAPGTWYLICCEWVVGLKSAGFTAMLARVLKVNFC